MDAWTDGRSVALSVAVGRSVEDLTASSPMRAISLRIWRSLSGRGSGQRAHHAPAAVELTLTCERARADARLVSGRHVFCCFPPCSTRPIKRNVSFSSDLGTEGLHYTPPPLPASPTPSAPLPAPRPRVFCGRIYGRRRGEIDGDGMRTKLFGCSPKRTEGRT